MLRDYEFEGDQAVTDELNAEPAALASPELDSASKETHEARSFELPGKVWAAMFASYALFFAGLIVGTGRDGSALFAIVISVFFAIMFFATATILKVLSKLMHRLAGRPKRVRGMACPDLANLPIRTGISTRRPRSSAWS